MTIDTEAADDVFRQFQIADRFFGPPDHPDRKKREKSVAAWARYEFNTMLHEARRLLEPPRSITAGKHRPPLSDNDKLHEVLTGINMLYGSIDRAWHVLLPDGPLYRDDADFLRRFSYYLDRVKLMAKARLVQDSPTKRGRPDDERRHAALARAAAFYELWTGKRATHSTGSKFPKFVSAVFDALDQDRTGNMRDSIRKTLATRPGS